MAEGGLDFRSSVAEIGNHTAFVPMEQWAMIPKTNTWVLAPIESVEEIKELTGACNLVFAVGFTLLGACVGAIWDIVYSGDRSGIGVPIAVSLGAVCGAMFLCGRIIYKIKKRKNTFTEANCHRVRLSDLPRVLDTQPSPTGAA